MALTCQTEQQAEDDDELEENGQPLKSVKLPAGADSGETSCTCPCGGGVMVATLLKKVQAENLNDPSKEDDSHQWSDGSDIFVRKRH